MRDQLDDDVRLDTIRVLLDSLQRELRRLRERERAAAEILGKLRASGQYYLRDDEWDVVLDRWLLTDQPTEHDDRWRAQLPWRERDGAWHPGVISFGP